MNLADLLVAESAVNLAVQLAGSLVGRLAVRLAARLVGLRAAPWVEGSVECLVAESAVNLAELSVDYLEYLLDLEKVDCSEKELAGC